jgi:hypothetical protein
VTFKPPIAPNTAVDRAHVYDESTALPVRDGLKFVGTGVTATDDANNDATIVTIPGASITSGNEPYTVVDGLSATPRSVTDWGPLINTAVTNGAKRFLFGPFEYPFSTQINLNETYALVFEGAGGAVHPTLDDRATSSLVWKLGASSGTAITASGSDGLVFRDMGIYYDVNAYDGDLIFLGLSFTQTGSPVIDCCSIGTYLRSSSNSGLGQAHSLINARNMVGGRIMRTSFRGGKYLIYGATTASGFSAGIDDNKFLMNLFESATIAYFGNIGTYWKIHYNTFYGGSFGAYATPQIIGYDATGVNTSIFSLCFNEFWDGEPPITQNVNNTWTARICSNDFFSPLHPHLIFNGLSPMLIVEDNSFNTQLSDGGASMIDLGNSATAFKAYVRLKGNVAGATGRGTTWADLVTNTAGHGYLEMDNPLGSDFSVTEIVHTIGRERVRDATSIAGVTQAAVAAGQGANVSGVRLIGNDGAGIIQLDVTSSALAAAAVDITFSRAIPRGFSGNLAWSGAQEVPSVQLTPIQIGTTSIAIAQDVKAYPKHAVGPVNTGWSLAFRVAPSGSGTIAFAYRVIQT